MAGIRTPLQDARFQVTVTGNKVERLTAQLADAKSRHEAAEAKVAELEAAEMNELLKEEQA